MVTIGPELPRVPSRSGNSTPRSSGCSCTSGAALAERHLPRDLARMDIDRQQVRAGRLDERSRAELALRVCAAPGPPASRYMTSVAP